MAPVGENCCDGSMLPTCCQPCCSEPGPRWPDWLRGHIQGLPSRSVLCQGWSLSTGTGKMLRKQLWGSLTREIRWAFAPRWAALNLSHSSSCNSQWTSFELIRKKKAVRLICKPNPLRRANTQSCLHREAGGPGKWVRVTEM